MTSVIVPPVDLAPGMPSRVVTISATDVTEGGQSLAGQMVRFALSDTLDVTSGGDVIAKTQAEVVLDADGNGSIRLPVYSDGVKTWCGDPDWVILVTATWGSQKAIRVPAGTSSIALSSLSPVRPLRGREKQWAVTGAGITVVEGSQWGASVQLVGGVLSFVITVPPGGTAYYRGVVGTALLDTVTGTGVYAQPFAANATTARGYPIQASGILTVTTEAASGTTWQVWDADSGRGRWKRARISGAWSAWERTDSTFQNRGLLGSRDLDGVIEDGVWHQIYSSGATTAVNYPVDTSGVLTVSTAGDRVYQRYSADADRGEFRRVQTAGVWGAWTRTSSTLKNRGTLGTFDLDTVVDEGTWYQRWASLATSAAHYPVAATGQLEVRTLLAETGTRSQMFYPDDMEFGVWRRVATSSTWTAWRRIDGAGDTPVTPEGGTAERRQVRLSMARKRLLGGPGTNGRAAVSFRFDDGHAAFGSKVVPLLRQHGLPAFAAVSERYLDESGVSNVAVQQWAINDGVEITAHSRNHGTETGAGPIKDSLVTWADDLQSRVGHIVVDTWTFPGGGDFDGLDRGAQAQSYSETYAGRLLLERYAVPYGATGGWLSPLSGEPTIGQSHVTIEAATLAQVQEWVRLAQDSGTGIVLMLHPERLDTAGHMSSATLGQVFAWVAAEREAGRLAVLTGTGISLAHKGAPANLLPRLSSWTGTNWGAGEERSTTGTFLLSTDVTINGFAASRGAPVELSLEVDGDAGTQVQLALSAPGLPLDTTRTVTLTGTGWQRVHNVATIPSGMGFGTSFTASVRKTTAGSLTVRAPRLTTI